MNKRKILIPLFGLCALTMILVGVKEKETHKVEAAFIENTFIKENFNTKKINEDLWDNNGAELIIDESSMRFTPTQYLWTNHLLLNNYTISESVEIDIELSTSNASGWFAFSFGSPNSTARFPDAKAALVFNHMLPGASNGGILERSTNNSLSGAETLNDSPFRSLDEHKILKLFVEILPDGGGSKLYFDIYNKDGSAQYNHGEDIYDFDVSLTGLLGMNTFYKDTSIYSFVMKKMSNNEVIYSDDFVDSGVSYLSSGDGVWKTSSFTEEDVVISPQGMIGLNDDSSLTLKKPIADPMNLDIDVVYKASFDINYSKMDFSSIAGIEIGKETKTSNNLFVGLKRNAVGYSLIALDKDGGVLETVTTSYDEFITHVSLKVHNNGGVEFYNSSIGISTSSENVFGYISLSIKNSEEENRLAVIDNFELQTALYVDRAAEDVATNFNGTKDEEFFGDIIKDFYVPTSEWRITPDISLPVYRDDYEGEEEQNGYIQFNSSNGQTFFGSKSVFYEYVVKFDIEIITSADNLRNTSGFGLQVGMQKFGGYFENYQSLSLTIARNDDTNTLRSKIEAQNGTFTDPAFDPYCKDGDNNYVNLFDKDGEGNNAKFNVMYVVRNNKVTMYFKNQSEPEEALAIPRAEMEVKGNTDGYCGVVGREGLTFRLDNYSVTNLDYDTPESSYLPVVKDGVEYQNKTRLDFSKISTTSALKLNNASINSTLDIADDGSVQTSGILNNGILRLNLKEVEDNLTLSFGKTNILINNSDSKKEIIYSDEANEYKQELDQYFSFNNSFIEIQKTGNSYQVIYCGNQEPLSSCGDTMKTYQLDAGDGYHPLIISSHGLSKISKLCFINFDSHFAIETRNYDPAKDDITPWIERPTEEEVNGIVNKKTSNLPLILGTTIPLTIGGLALIAAIVFTIIFIVKMNKRRKQA